MTESITRQTSPVPTPAPLSVDAGIRARTAFSWSLLGTEYAEDLAVGNLSKMDTPDLLRLIASASRLIGLAEATIAAKETTAIPEGVEGHKVGQR